MALILVVEDDGFVNNMICEALTDAGYEADGCRSRAEAAQMLAARRYDLILTDVRLPDGRGYDLAAFAATRGSRVLCVTGHPEEVRGIGGQQFGYLRKPFRMRELLKRVALQLNEPATG
jgi:DNA-binding response OmpR family regulator